VFDSVVLMSANDTPSALALSLVDVELQLWRVFQSFRAYAFHDRALGGESE